MSKEVSYKYIVSKSVNTTGKLLNYDEFYLSDKNNIIYKIILFQKENEIIIKSKKYLLSFNYIDIQSQINHQFNNNQEIYNYILNLFNDNKIFIKDILIAKEMQLAYNDKEKIIFVLKYNKENKDINYMELINKNLSLENEISTLKKENDLLKNELSNIKQNINNNSGPHNLKELTNITNDSYSDDVSDNTFTVFKSIHDYIFLIYSTKIKSIICFNLIEEKKIIEIKNAHKEFITNFRHYIDKKNKRDLVMTISCADRNIKLWDSLNWECILDLKHLYHEGFIYSSAFLEYSDEIYLVATNYNYYNSPGFVEIYDLNKKLLKKLNGSNENTSYVDTYNEKINSKYHYIITGNSNRVVAYIYETNTIFKQYKDNYNNNHLSIILHQSEDCLKLIESCYDGNIRIWNFYTGALIIKIQIGNNWLYGVCVWNDSFLFVGCSDKTIKLVELKEGFIAKNMKGHNNSVLTIKKIKHPKYGNCLISQGYNEDQIKIWICK